MAASKITSLTSISTIDTANDPLPIVDVSDTSQSASGTTKKVTVDQIVGAGAAGSFSTLAASGTLSIGGVASFPDGTSALPSITNTGDTNTGAYFPAADTFGIVTGGSERFRIDPVGNVGIGGVTPSSGSDLSSIEIGNVGNAVHGYIGDVGVYVTTAARYNVGWKYTVSSKAATLYSCEAGAHKWLNAPSGTAGNAITFTQAMTLDSSGNLGIGKTPSLGLLDVNADAYFNTVRVGLGGGAVASNTAVGNGAMAATATGANNVAVGFQALTANTSGTANIAVGRIALGSNQTGSNNTALGHNSLSSNTASDNTAVGFQALTANTSGTDNVAVGRSALAANVTASNNTAIGRSALGANTASNNTAVGHSSLSLNTSGNVNVAVGTSALSSNTTGSGNVAVGTSALSTNATTSQSTAVGRSALALSTAADNTALGYQAGDVLTTGANNTIIGSGADASAATGTGQIVIGKGVTGTANNRITVGITTNIAELDLDGADTSWAASSDERLKKNVADYAAGLDVITALRPVTYQWRSRKEVPTELTNYYADSDEPVHGDASKTYHGFIAQEVKAVLDANPSVPNGQHLWEQRDDGVQTLAPADLVPILVNAIKELNARLSALENK